MSDTYTGIWIVNVQGGKKCTLRYLSTIPIPGGSSSRVIYQIGTIGVHYTELCGFIPKKVLNIHTGIHGFHNEVCADL